MAGKTSNKKDTAKVNEKNDKEVEIEMKEENKELDKFFSWIDNV